MGWPETHRSGRDVSECHWVRHPRSDGLPRPGVTRGYRGTGARSSINSAWRLLSDTDARRLGFRAEPVDLSSQRVLSCGSAPLTVVGSEAEPDPVVCETE